MSERYILVKSKTDKRMIAYTAQCKKEKLPIVYARGNGEKFLFVEMDLIFVVRSHAYNKNELFREEMIKAIEQATKEKYKRHSLPGLYTVVHRVPIKHAEQLMIDFLTLYDKHIPTE